MTFPSRASVLVTLTLLTGAAVTAAQPPALDEPQMPDMAFLEFLGGMLEEDGELIDPLDLIEPTADEADKPTQPDAQRAPREEN